jgi:hypothetical protein
MSNVELLNEIDSKVSELNEVLKRFTSKTHSMSAKVSELDLGEMKSRKIFIEVVEHLLYRRLDNTISVFRHPLLRQFPFLRLKSISQAFSFLILVFF